MHFLFISFRNQITRIAVSDLVTMLITQYITRKYVLSSKAM
jgi:hypothetical protein